MNEVPIVLLLGESLLTESIALGLANKLMMNVIRMDPAIIDLNDCFLCLQPDLIMVNLGDPYSKRLVSLLNEQQEMKLAGLDMADCQLILLTGHNNIASTIQELSLAIQKGELK